ncbi:MULTISPECIES: ricin-type beta-trefoil lectin domain protein [Streptomyces]|uniref:ricin-type beta-trefoil lectin domain protein n=1 Tax=Streptomyces TaxID=1883 RepID=UPI001488B00B|nr:MULTISPECIES: ricin-type beta-trefoil lectin domain protein [Streptomyces]
MFRSCPTRTARDARSERRPGQRRVLRRVLAAALTTLVAIPAGVLSGASPAGAADPLNAAQFGGVNWARPGDSFVNAPVVPEGLSVSDSYATVRAKADAILTGFQHSGANTVRLPINKYSVPGTTWGDAYTGAIDAATAKGMKVILGYWEESPNGKVDDTAAFNAMWDPVVAKYASNPLVLFESFNEPRGYTAAQWADVAAAWIARYPSVPRNRIVVSGSGFNEDVTTVCGDSRLDGTYVSLHFYAFSHTPRSYAEWVSLFKSKIGSCGSRTILDEFGGPMDDGRDYNQAGSSDNFVLYMRAVIDTAHDLGMGSTYWPALGGKHTMRPDYDWYSLYALHGSGTDLTLSVRNPTQMDRLKYLWGLAPRTPLTTLKSVGVPGCLDIPGGTQQNTTQVQIWNCTGATHQQWTRTATGQITVFGGAKCLDALGNGTANGTKVVIYDCNGQDNQKWTFYSDGTVRGVESGLCLDVNQSTSKVQLWSCWGGTNQKWQIA